MLTWKKIKAIVIFLLSALLYIGNIVSSFANGFELIFRQSNDGSVLNETQFENKCQILSQEGLPLFGGLTIALTFWQNIFAGLFVHLNGGYYLWSLASVFCLWPFAIVGKASVVDAIFNDENDLDGARLNSRMAIIVETWLLAAPQIALQSGIIASGIQPGAFQLTAIIFSLASVSNYALFFNFEIIIENMKAYSGRQKLSRKTKIFVFLQLAPFMIIGTAYRIVLVTSLIYFFKSVSPVPLLVLTASLISALTCSGSNTLQESVSSALLFFAPFYLGQITFMTKKFARISCHVITILGSIFIGILLVCHHFELTEFTSGSILSLSECTPLWISSHLQIILQSFLGLGLLYSITTELYICIFGHFFEEIF